MKQYKAKYGAIYDADTDEQIGVFVPTHCSKKFRDRIVKLAVNQLNNEERGKELAKK